MKQLPSIYLSDVQFTFDPRLQQLRIVKPEEILLFLGKREAIALRDFLSEHL